MKDECVGDGAQATETDITAVIEQVRAADLGLIDLVFSDIAGSEGADHTGILDGATLRRGYRFDGAALTGGRRSNELDLYLIPDPGTFAILSPGDSYQRRGGLLLQFGGVMASRSMATRARRCNGSSNGPQSRDRLSGRDRDGVLPAGGRLDQSGDRTRWGGYFDTGEDVVSRTRDAIISSLAAAGFGLGGAHHETGPGQEEIDLRPTDALRMADQLITIRQSIRTAARQFGLRATFMPKPFTDAPGSGVHVFQQFRQLGAGSDLLRDAHDNLTPMALQIIGGQIDHAAAICAVLCPTVNSYKRLRAVIGPPYANWRMSAKRR